ncbi:MAG TPA: AzlD domain-containing protein [Mycobacteriales bacterium]|jgi:branched-subunit amino acid transport protein|nr:AzlD domain-containing protein [Mycobacteriales bacterium]
MSVWIAIVLAGLGSYLLRMLPVALLGRFPTPAWLDRAGVLVAPVAFAALAATAVAGGAGMDTNVLARVVAVTVAAGVAHRTRSTAATLAVGMAALWIASAAFPG